MKRLISMLLICVLLCAHAVLPALATEAKPERVTVEVNTMADINEFYKSPAYNSSNLYSFIIKTHPSFRMPCSNCGNASWTGSEYRVDEVDIYLQECPFQSGLSSDRVVVYQYYYLERCRSCGYEIVHDEYFFEAYCQYSPEWAPPFEAWDGQSWITGGYDIHEDKSVWYQVPSRYH